MECYDKEYHPVIEEYITNYAEDTLSEPERTAFTEVLAVDDDLRQFAYSAKEGRRLLEQLRYFRSAAK